MFAADIKVGQTVTTRKFPDRIWTVLDRHPLQGHWWLADQQTGHVHQDWFDDGSNLVLVEDPYRPGEVFHTRGEGAKRARARTQDWAVASGDAGNVFFLYHLHTGMRFGYRFKTIGQAKQAMDQAAASGRYTTLTMDDIKHLATVLP